MFSIYRVWQPLWRLGTVVIVTKVIEVFGSVGREAAACAELAASRVLRSSRDQVKLETTERPLIVLVHGFMSSARDMSYWRECLSEKQPTIAVDYRSIGGDFFKTGQSLLDTLESVPTGSILIGHSLGGVMSRYVAEASPGKYAAVVTVCSPNVMRHLGFGSRLTARVAGVCKTVIDRADEYLERSDEWVVEGTDCYTMGAELDLIVTEKSSRLQGAPHFTIEKSGHMSVLKRSEVPKKLLDIVSIYEGADGRRWF
jgi:predicted alpha/beta hydrolase family esterase